MERVIIGMLQRVGAAHIIWWLWGERKKTFQNLNKSLEFYEPVVITSLRLKSICEPQHKFPMDKSRDLMSRILFCILAFQIKLLRIERAFIIYGPILPNSLELPVSNAVNISNKQSFQPPHNWLKINEKFGESNVSRNKVLFWARNSEPIVKPKRLQCYGVNDWMRFCSLAQIFLIRVPKRK